MKELAKIYSEIGLKEMIEDTNNEIIELKRRKDDVGESWTEGKIEGWKWQHDRDIEYAEKHLNVLEEALEIKMREIIGK